MSLAVLGSPPQNHHQRQRRNEMSHTSTPFEQSGVHVFSPSDQKVIASCYTEGFLGHDVMMRYDDTDLCGKNAAFIVLACNSHDGLIAEQKDYERTVARLNRENDQLREGINALKEQLAETRAVRAALVTSRDWVAQYLGIPGHHAAAWAMLAVIDSALNA